MEKFSGFRSILSGPAGGVVGYAQTAYEVYVNLLRMRSHAGP